MKIKINEVIREGSKKCVIFLSEHGNAKGFWNGNDPVVGEEYFVELDIVSRLIWGSNIKKVDEEKYAIGIELNTLYIVGFLESVEDDGYTVIRLGDSIISLDVEGNPPSIGVFVKIETDQVNLFNVKY